jgi:MFS transporter, SP family, sugar:H+ symporter
MAETTRYGTYFFAICGVEDAFLANIILQVCSLIAMFFMIPSLRYIGRRTILLWGGIIMSSSMLIVAAVGTASPSNPISSKILVAFTCIWSFFYTWSWGSVGWVVVAEIPSTVLRARTQGLATITGWSSTLIVNATLPYLINPNAANWGMKVRMACQG